MQIAMTFLLISVALVWSVPSAIHVPAPVPQLLPVDEAPRRPDFLAFRQELQRIVARRDLPALLKVLDPNIKNSFGGGAGIEDFKKTWELDTGAGPLWSELGTVLALGGSFIEADTFAAPYVYSRWPDNFDAFLNVAMIGSDVRIRSAADAQAPVLATWSYAILPLAGDSYPERPWTSVKLPDGRTGFVATRLVRSPIDRRAFFERIDGRWRMTVFIAGD